MSRNQMPLGKAKGYYKERILLKKGNCLPGILLLLFILAVGLCVLNGMVFPFSHELYRYPRLIIWLSCAGILLAWKTGADHIIRLDEQILQQKADRLEMLYVCTMFVVHLLLGYWMEYTPSGDNYMLYQASQTLARDGKFETGSDFLLYFGRYSNQWGFLLILTIFYRLLFAVGIQNTFYPVVVLQTVLYVFAFRSMFRIVTRFSGNRGRLLLIGMLLSCLPLCLAASVLYTDTFSMPFIIFTLEWALRVGNARGTKERYTCAAMCGLMAFLGGQIKMTVLIMLIAAGIYWIYALPLRKMAVSVAIATMVVGIGIGTVHGIMLSFILDRQIYHQEHTPVIHWIMMSIPSADNPYGGYYSRDYAITWGMMDEGASQSEVMASILSRMKDKIYTLRYPNRLALAILRKNSAALTDGTFGMTEMLDDRPVRWNLCSEIVLESGKYYRIYGAITTGIWMAQLLLSGMCAWKELRTRRADYTVLYVACLGIILFLMIWEARSRYLFGFVPVLLMIPALYGNEKDDIIRL